MTPATESDSERIALPRSLRRPIRVRVSDQDSGRLHEYSVRTPLRVGRGEDCDIRLDADQGPDTLLEFLPVDGPTKLLMPARFSGDRDQFDISIDGERFIGEVRELRPGATVQIRDRRANRQVDLIVGEPSVWSKTPKWIVFGLILSFLAALAYGAYLFRFIGDTNERIGKAELRLSEAEIQSRRNDEHIVDILSRAKNNQVAVGAALDEIRLVQRRAQTELKSQFTTRMREITAESERTLLTLAREDTEGRNALAKATRDQVDTLRQEISGKLVKGIERFKALEEQVYSRHASQLETLSIQESRFKRILPVASKAVLYVRSEFSATFTITGETKQFDSSGTAFLVSGSGVAVAPLHVLEPWRFDEDFLALRELGVVELEPHSVRRFVWLAGEQVVDPQDPEQPLIVNAFGDSNPRRGLMVLHQPVLETTTKLVMTPLGVAEIESPMPGPTDLAVFQLLDFATSFSHLRLAATDQSPHPLDKVLVVGFPLGRLDTGRSVAQGVMGSVRRVGQDLLELDAQLHPGISGAPVLDDQARVLGMAIAVFGTVSYGVSVPATRIEQAVTLGRDWVLRNEKRLAKSGCGPGPIDGTLDEKTWLASRQPNCAFD